MGENKNKDKKKKNWKKTIHLVDESPEHRADSFSFSFFGQMNLQSFNVYEPLQERQRVEEQGNNTF
jgi:hypothetical protein